jgi:ABC-type multidrug transport system fused ATPase/permease subunit
VFIDGRDVRTIPLAVLRRAIGFVPQEPFLFSASIADNIALGATGEQATRAAIVSAAAVSRLDKDVEDLPAGYDTGRRRARHHAVRRPEAAHGNCARSGRRSAHPDSG